jgi:hypothetical protein
MEQILELMKAMQGEMRAGHEILARFDAHHDRTKASVNAW